MKQDFCTLHAHGCMSNNSWIPTGLFQLKFGKETAVLKILNDCRSCWNRSCQGETYPVRPLRERPDLNVTPTRYQGRHRGRSYITKAQNTLETSNRGCHLLGARDLSMCYKTNGLHRELDLKKIKLRFASFGARFTVQEHSLWFFCFILNAVVLHNN